MSGKTNREDNGNLFRTGILDDRCLAQERKKLHRAASLTEYFFCVRDKTD